MKIAICCIGKEDSGELLPLLLFERARSCIKRGCGVFAAKVDGEVKSETIEHLQSICDQGELTCLIACRMANMMLKPCKSPTEFSETAVLLNDLARLSNPTWLCLQRRYLPPEGDAFLIDGGCFCYRDGELLCSISGSGRMLIKSCA